MAIEVPKLPVDEVGDVRLQVAEDPVGLRLRQLSLSDRGVEVLLLCVVERLNETGRRLSVRGGDLRQGLPGFELGPELLLGEPQVGRRSFQTGSVVLEAEAARPVTGAGEEQRQLAGLDLGLHPVAFGLRDPAGHDGCVDTILESLLERVTQLAGVDPELLRRIGDDGPALFLRGADLRCADRDSSAGDRDCRGGPGCNLAFRVLVHAPIRPRATKRSVRGI